MLLLTTCLVHRENSTISHCAEIILLFSPWFIRAFIYSRLFFNLYTTLINSLRGLEKHKLVLPLDNRLFCPATAVAVSSTQVHVRSARDSIAHIPFDKGESGFEHVFLSTTPCDFPLQHLDRPGLGDGHHSPRCWKAWSQTFSTAFWACT